MKKARRLTVRLEAAVSEVIYTSPSGDSSITVVSDSGPFYLRVEPDPHLAIREASRDAIDAYNKTLLVGIGD